MYYGDSLYYSGYLSYLLYMLPAIVLTLAAQLAVKGTFRKYSRVSSRRGLTGAEAARAIVNQGGASYVGIEPTSGNLTDHFDPSLNVIRLSQSTYGSSSIAAVGVAAHEAGHALQYAEGYSPIKIRTALVPVCNNVARFAPLLLIIGILFDIFALYMAGIIAFSAVVLLQLVTLPVEFNASRRALAAISESGALDDDERAGARKVLTAAALTYVAALFTSLLQLLYYVSRYRGRSNRR